MKIHNMKNEEEIKNKIIELEQRINQRDSQIRERLLKEIMEEKEIPFRKSEENLGGENLKLEEEFNIES